MANGCCSKLPSARFSSWPTSILSLTTGVVATQYGWWQGCRDLDLPGYDPFGPDGANANLLISNAAVDPISGSVQHRSVKCRVRKKDLFAATTEEQA
jgi:hypothetical protein